MQQNKTACEEALEGTLGSGARSSVVAVVGLHAALLGNANGRLWT